MRKQDPNSDEQTHKKFAKQTKGRAAAKRTLNKKKKLGLDTEPNRGRNPKAFTRPSDGSHKIAQRKRNIEQAESNARIPKVDKSLVPSSELQPPTLVAVVGPEGCGKSTFIQSFVKACVGKSLARVYGPVTFTNGNPQRPKRYTFLECPPTLTAMVDVCKVAEIVVMVFDAATGFEMESFEFLTLANVHGLPHIFGLLTHLDALKNNKTLKKTKKKMRHRFSQEVAANAGKLFYITGLEAKTGLYKRKEMLLLGHYLASVKTEPTTWRQAHSHLLVDRFQDVTARQPDGERGPSRQVQCYGYVRGKPLDKDTRVHMPGVGDFSIEKIEVLRDPCGAGDAQSAALTLKDRKRQAKAKAKRRAIFAPMCDLGELSYDPGGEVFVHNSNPSHFVNASLDDDVGDLHAGARMLRDLRALGYSTSAAVLEPAAQPEQAMQPQAALPELTEVVKPIENPWDDPVFRAASRGDQTMTVPASADIDYMADNAFEALRNRFVTGKVFKSLIGENTAEIEELQEAKGYESVDSAPETDEEEPPATTQNATDDTDVQGLLDFFTSHKEDYDEPAEAPATIEAAQPGQPALPVGVSDDYFARKQEKRRKLFEGKPSFSDSAPVPEKPSVDDDPLPAKPTNIHKNIFEAQQARLQATVDEMAQHSSANYSALLGFYPGLYARVTLSGVPAGFVDAFANAQGFSESDPARSHFPPLVLGGLQPTEANEGTVHARVRKHRWKTMQALRNRSKAEGRQTCSVRSQDPIVVSAGWRRFETQPVFAIEENGPTNRRRYMKYLPEHSHCVSAYHGPWVPPNSGVCAFRLSSPLGADGKVKKGKKDFRIVLTGYTMEVSSSDAGDISKKLKLIGYPDQIAQNTVFVKDMFNSAEEAARFEGAKVKTVAGIRGAIKKALPGKRGVVRCTFEDKILKSDIVCCRVYTKVPVPRHYSPVTNWVLAGEGPLDPEVGRWQRSSTAAERYLAAHPPQDEAPGPEKSDAGYAASLAAKRKGTKALLHSDLKFQMPRGLARVAPFAQRAAVAGVQAKRQQAMQITTDIKKDLAELTTVVLDGKEKRQEAVERHFKHIQARMANVDAIKASIKQAKFDKKAAEEEERKQRLMKKLKKEHAKLGEFQKLKKQRM